MTRHVAASVDLNITNLVDLAFLVAVIPAPVFPLHASVTAHMPCLNPTKSGHCSKENVPLSLAQAMS